MSYRAPVRDMMFVIRELAGIDAVAQLPGFEEAGAETARRCWRKPRSSTKAWSHR
jgi:hypothetical protein